MGSERESNENETKTFRFSFQTCCNKDILSKLEVPVPIPYDGSTRELVQRVINMFHIPVYLEEELNEELAKFVTDETKAFHNNRDEKLLNQLKNGEINVDGVIKTWEKAFKDNVVEYAEQKGTSDEEVFAMAYHKLVHSPALETILQVESTYAKTVAEMLKNRDKDIKELTQRQTEEMEEKVRLLNTFTTEEDINELAGKHFEKQALVAGRWGSQLDALSQTQRADYRTWLMDTLNSYHTLNTPSNSPLATFTNKTFNAPLPSAPQRLEESFTIHLGSQLKQTHNIRIVAMDMQDLCRTEIDDDSAVCRLQTALGLYSNELTGVLLLCEAGPGEGGAGGRDDGAPTEYHFLSKAAQLVNIIEKCKEPIEKRNAQRLKENPSNKRVQNKLQCGDMYITKHSNLAEAHVVFHLVVDKTLKSGDITSRHPAILGLRNVLKVACCNDITNISLPLLLTHELTDEMTAAWCLRRAELVLKCVKGFMLETGGWGGAELSALQLCAPAAIAPALFHSLAQLPANIFRLSNVLKFTQPR